MAEFHDGVIMTYRTYTMMSETLTAAGHKSSVPGTMRGSPPAGADADSPAATTPGMSAHVQRWGK